MKGITSILVLVFFVFSSCSNAHACSHKVILKANKPFAEQVNEPNTVYIISSEFDLGGKEVSIPEGCTLKFKGGLLKNGKLIGNNTDIDSPRMKIMDASLPVDGTWKVKEVFSEWFGPKVDGSDDTAPLIAFFNFPAPKKTLKAGTYGVYELHCEGLKNTEVYAYGATLQYLRTNPDIADVDLSVLTNFNGPIDNISQLKGFLHIYGLTIDGNSHRFKYNPEPEKPTSSIINHHTIRFVLLEELELSDCAFKNSFMTAVKLDICKKSNIRNCKVINSGESVSYTPVDYWYTWEGICVNDEIFTKQGWVKIDCDECLVRDSYFENIGGSFASANCRCFKCINNTVYENRGYAFELSSSYRDRNVEIVGNKVHGLGSAVIDMTHFEIPDNTQNNVILNGNEFSGVGYNSHRTKPTNKPFLMIYRNKKEKGTGVLNVTIENNVFVFDSLASQGLVRSDNFMFSNNLCSGFTGDDNQALFFCGNDENQGCYYIVNNQMDFNSGALAIIRSPKYLEVSDNTVNTSKSQALVYLQGEKEYESVYRINNNKVEGVSKMVFVSTSPQILYLTGNQSNSIEAGIIRTTSDLAVKCVFENNSFLKISGSTKNISLVKGD